MLFVLFFLIFFFSHFFGELKLLFFQPRDEAGHRFALLNADVADACAPQRCQMRATAESFTDVAGKSKFVPADHQLVETARNIGIVLGD